MELEFVNTSNFIPSTFSVFLASVVIFIVSYWFSKLIFKKNLFTPIAIALVKSGLFFIYYTLFLNTDFFSIDSYNYMNTAIRVTERIDSNFDFFIDLLSFKLMHIYGLGHYIYNAFISSLLIIFHTKSAIVPITANVIISVLSAWYFTKTLLLIGFKERYARWYFLLFVLHWETLSWTTMTLLKDNFICFLTIALFYLITLLFARQFKWYHLIALIYTIGALLFSRFYIMPITATCLIVYNYLRIFANKKTVRTLALLILTPIFFLLCLLLIWDQFGDYLQYLFDFNSNPLYGVIRFFLTPIPYYIAESRSYMIIPATLNWLLIPFTLVGIYRCYGFGGLFRLLILFYIAIIFFYGVYSPQGGATGPRHKIQVIFIYILFQLVGVISLLFPKVKLTNKN